MRITLKAGAVRKSAKARERKRKNSTWHEYVDIEYVDRYKTFFSSLPILSYGRS